MIRVNINYRIIFLALCLLFTFQSATVFSQEQQDKIVKLKEDYRIIRSESNAKIVRADGHDNEKWYMLETKNIYRIPCRLMKKTANCYIILCKNMKIVIPHY